MRLGIFCALWALLMGTSLASEIVESFPAIFASYKLVPGLKPSIDHSDQMPYSLEEADAIVSRAFELCLNDAYIVVEVPGLRIEDFQHFQSFSNLRLQLTKSSTLISMPNVLSNDAHSTLDIHKFDDITRVYCNAQREVLNGANEDAIPKYIDSRTRFIEVHLPALDDGMEPAERKEILTGYDEFLQKIIREIPSPNIAVLYSTTTVHAANLTEISDRSAIIRQNEIPDNPRVLTRRMRDKVTSSKRMIFPDITIFDKSRYYEYERNTKGQQKKVDDDQPDDTWIERKEKKVEKDSSLYRFGEDSNEIDNVLDDQSFLKDNALLIGCTVAVFGMILSFDALKLLFTTLKGLFGGKAEATPEKKNQ